jgi:hypothetical protein
MRINSENGKALNGVNSDSYGNLLKPVGSRNAGPLV